MQTQRIVQIGLLLLGIVLLVMGIRETDSFGSQVSKFFTGSFTDRAVWLMLGGAVVIVLAASYSQIVSRKQAL